LLFLIAVLPNMKGVGVDNLKVSLIQFYNKFNSSDSIVYLLILVKSLQTKLIYFRNLSCSSTFLVKKYKQVLIEAAVLSEPAKRKDMN
jgi:hypothetical protein